MIDDDALGDYRVVRPLGQGGMGQVFLGHDPVLDRPVAIKLPSATAPSAAARERFLIEARAIARLTHPNVVAVYRAGETRDGRPFLVQELVSGRSLDRLAPPLPAAEVRRIGVEIARGLAAAHRRGVLHRDLKPANVMIADDGTVKLLDFGLAKLRPLDERELAPPAPPAPTPALGPEPTPATRDGRRPAGDSIDAAAETADAPGPPTLGSRAPFELAAPARGTAAGSPWPTRPVDVELTQPGAILGTPRYMAPEQWRGEPATERSDLYALGAVLFELASGRPVHPTRDLEALRLAVETGDAPPLASVAAHVDPALAAVVDRALARDPAARPASADAMAQALATAATAPAGEATPRPDNPYRGLAAFAAEDRALFFGRGADVGAIVDRLRGEQAVVVVGDSGVGKSSLVRAGVLPAIAAGGLGGDRTWATVAIRPGDDPAAATARALGDHADLAAALAAATTGGRGLALFLDQAEELITTCARDVAAGFADALVAALARDPGLRVIAAVRGDLVTRLAEVPGLTALVTRGLHLVGPLDDAGRREAIVGPAHAAGVAYEPAAVDELVADSTGRGGLPLLQFALTVLWQRRDPATARITRADVAAIGGVAGALARHADGVLAALDPAGRRAARRLLTAMVSTDGTTAVRDEDGLALAQPGARAALAALIDGRLVVARDGAHGASYALAHDALIVHWATLAAWLADDRGVRARRQRLAAAADEWARLGRGRDGLLARRQLDEAAELDGLADRERALVTASRRALRRRRTFAVGLTALALAAIASAWLGTRWATRRDRDRAVDGHALRAAVWTAIGEHHRAALADAHAAAFAAFDRSYTTYLDEDDAHAARAWRWAGAVHGVTQRSYRAAASAVEAAFLLDPTPALRHRMAELLARLAELAELARDDAGTADLRARTATYDPGVAGRWTAPATLTVDVSPAARVIVRCRIPDSEPRALEPTPVLDAIGAHHRVQVWPTTCLVEAGADAHVDVRAPVLLAPGEAHTLRLALPPARDQPPGFVHVPAGRFLFGAPDPDSVRESMAAPPQHVIELPAFWIARTEVTFDDYIAFLDALPDDDRALRRPRASDFAGALELEAARDGSWTLVFRHADTVHRVGRGQPFRYPPRDRRAEQDWSRFPVAGVSIDDARAYAAWLATTGRVAGARLCTDREWERAARGADDRNYPHGDVLAGDDANRAETYGHKAAAFGPDEVGSYPASDSPFGVADMTGNVWELIDSPGHVTLLRGGGWYSGSLSVRVTNRSAGAPSQRNSDTGFRLCATAR